MSHIVKCKVTLKNVDALNRAIEHLGLENLGQKTHKLYDGSYTGVGVKLPAWNYPVVINTETGEARYDNYGGSWGKQVELDKLVQRYSMEVVNEQAEGEGMTVEEMSAEDAYNAGLIDEMPEDTETRYMQLQTVG